MAALDVLGSADHLPPVLSGHNAYWMWPGRASDQTVPVVNALGWLRPDFASCRLLTIYHAPYQVQNGWTALVVTVIYGSPPDQTALHALLARLETYHAQLWSSAAVTAQLAEIMIR